MTLDTGDGLGGIDFEWASLSNEQKAALQLGGVDADVAEKRLNYLRGSSAYEQRNGGDLRDRVNGALGDIVNSDPVYVDNLESRLQVVPAALSASYSTYRAGLSSRQKWFTSGPMVAYCMAYVRTIVELSYQARSCWLMCQIV